MTKTTDPRIPVTIITGFLGSGKTTLLNNIIRKHPEKRFAIIENEIGEIGIDGGLIVGAKENIFELSNGCICCSLNGDFNEVIENLLEHSEPFDHLLIETTGIADPNAVVQSFLSSEFIQMEFCIDGVVCVADAVNMKNLINSEAEVRKQLALADTILINKSESVTVNHLQELQSMIETFNPSAQTHWVSQADISDIQLLNTNSFSGKSIEKSTLAFRNMALLKSNTAHDIKAIGISIPGSFDYDKFNYWIESYLFFNSKDVFRIKGILSFANKKEKQIFQAVSLSYTIEDGSEWQGEQRFCKLVFIGKNLVRNDLEWALHRLVQ